MTIDVVGFDGDDTLWHNETIFSMTQERFTALLEPYADPQRLEGRLLETERENVAIFGYGIKGFTLSMIETAIEVTEGRVSTEDIRTLVEFGKAMLAHPVELLDGAREAIVGTAQRCRVILITKGDLFDQESKLARSGLGDLFDGIEIVSEKDQARYRRVLRDHDVAPERFLMVGNSMRSDVLPVVAVGARAVHVPYHVTWALEEVPAEEHPVEGWWRLTDLAELPALLDELGVRSVAG